MLTEFNYKDISCSEIRNELENGDTVICIKKFPADDVELTAFVNQLGIPVTEPRNNNGQAVFDVKISLQNNFFRSVATSNLNFPLHTDCADFNTVPNCIGLLCVNPADQKQGTNTFMFVKDALNRFSESEIHKLLSKKWKFRNQSRSILAKEEETFKICYDRITMESFSELNKDEKQELNELDKIFEQLSFKIKLQEGDLVLFRNDLMLHGRDAIDIGSDRLIKRIRFSIDCK